jgi:hypothetical protein
VVAWVVVLPGLASSPGRQTAAPHPPVAKAPSPPTESSALASAALLTEWKAFVLTGQKPGEAEARLARANLERRTAERLFRTERAGEKPEEAAGRRQAVSEAAALAAADLGARGVEMLQDAVCDPRLAPEVLAGLSGQARPELVPVYVVAMRHRACRVAAAALAEEATGLELGSSPAEWRLWWELRTAGTRRNGHRPQP